MNWMPEVDFFCALRNDDFIASADLNATTIEFNIDETELIGFQWKMFSDAIEHLHKQTNTSINKQNGNKQSLKPALEFETGVA